MSRVRTVPLGGLRVQARLEGDVVSTARISVTQEMASASVANAKARKQPGVQLEPSGPTVTPKTFPPTPLVR